jgi:predicted nucleotidyltransferase
MGTPAMNEAELEDLLTPPDDAAVDRAIGDFARAVRRAYGERVKGIYLFGSRARGDHTRDSDADIAVVLRDGEWRDWPETKRLNDISYDVLLKTGADVQAWPITASAWRNPAAHDDANLIRAMRRDARPVGEHVV